MTCVLKYVRTDPPPTVSVCLFDGTEITLTNIFIIITPVKLTILFYHGRKCTRSCGSSTATRNPVDQDVEWIRFGMEGNHNSIHDEGVFKEFGGFIGLTENDVQYMVSGLSKRTTTQGRINFCMRRVNYTLVIINLAQDEIR